MAERVTFATTSGGGVVAEAHGNSTSIPTTAAPPGVPFPDDQQQSHPQHQTDTLLPPPPTSRPRMPDFFSALHWRPSTIPVGADRESFSSRYSTSFFLASSPSPCPDNQDAPNPRDSGGDTGRGDRSTSHNGQLTLVTDSVANATTSLWRNTTRLGPNAALGGTALPPGCATLFVESLFLSGGCVLLAGLDDERGGTCRGTLVGPSVSHTGVRPSQQHAKALSSTAVSPPPAPGSDMPLTPVDQGHGTHRPLEPPGTQTTPAITATPPQLRLALPTGADARPPGDTHGMSAPEASFCPTAYYTTQTTTGGSAGGGPSFPPFTPMTMTTMGVSPTAAGAIAGGVPPPPRASLLPDRGAHHLPYSGDDGSEGRSSETPSGDGAAMGGLDTMASAGAHQRHFPTRGPVGGLFPSTDEADAADGLPPPSSHAAVCPPEGAVPSPLPTFRLPAKSTSSGQDSASSPTVSGSDSLSMRAHQGSDPSLPPPPPAPTVAPPVMTTSKAPSTTQHRRVLSRGSAVGAESSPAPLQASWLGGRSSSSMLGTPTNPSTTVSAQTFAHDRDTDAPATTVVSRVAASIADLLAAEESCDGGDLLDERRTPTMALASASRTGSDAIGTLCTSATTWLPLPVAAAVAGTLRIVDARRPSAVAPGVHPAPAPLHYGAPIFCDVSFGGFTHGGGAIRSGFTRVVVAAGPSSSFPPASRRAPAAAVASSFDPWNGMDGGDRMASASSVEHPTVVHPCPFTVMAAASTKLRSASAAVFDARVSSTVDAPSPPWRCSAAGGGDELLLAFGGLTVDDSMCSGGLSVMYDHHRKRAAAAATKPPPRTDDLLAATGGDPDATAPLVRPAKLDACSVAGRSPAYTNRMLAAFAIAPPAAARCSSEKDDDGGDASSPLVELKVQRVLQEGDVPTPRASAAMCQAAQMTPETYAALTAATSSQRMAPPTVTTTVRASPPTVLGYVWLFGGRDGSRPDTPASTAVSPGGNNGVNLAVKATATLATALPTSARGDKGDSPRSGVATDAAQPLGSALPTSPPSSTTKSSHSSSNSASGSSAAGKSPPAKPPPPSTSGHVNKHQRSPPPAGFPMGVVTPKITRCATGMLPPATHDDAIYLGRVERRYVDLHDDDGEDLPVVAPQDPLLAMPPSQLFVTWTRLAPQGGRNGSNLSRWPRPRFGHTLHERPSDGSLWLSGGCVGPQNADVNGPSANAAAAAASPCDDVFLGAPWCGSDPLLWRLRVSSLPPTVSEGDTSPGGHRGGVSSLLQWLPIREPLTPLAADRVRAQLGLTELLLPPLPDQRGLVAWPPASRSDAMSAPASTMSSPLRRGIARAFHCAEIVKAPALVAAGFQQARCTGGDEDADPPVSANSNKTAPTAAASSHDDDCLVLLGGLSARRMHSPFHDEVNEGGGVGSSCFSATPAVTAVSLSRAEIYGHAVLAWWAEAKRYVVEALEKASATAMAAAPPPTPPTKLHHAADGAVQLLLATTAPISRPTSAGKARAVSGGAHHPPQRSPSPGPSHPGAASPKIGRGLGTSPADSSIGPSTPIVVHFAVVAVETKQAVEQQIQWHPIDASRSTPSSAGGSPATPLLLGGRPRVSPPPKGPHYFSIPLASVSCDAVKATVVAWLRQVALAWSPFAADIAPSFAASLPTDAAEDDIMLDYVEPPGMGVRRRPPGSGLSPPTAPQVPPAAGAPLIQEDLSLETIETFEAARPLSARRRPLHLVVLLKEAVKRYLHAAVRPALMGAVMGPAANSAVMAGSPPLAMGGPEASMKVAGAIGAIPLVVVYRATPHQFSLRKPIGKGTFGEVFQAMNDETSALFAVKQCRLPSRVKNEPEEAKDVARRLLLDEIRTMRPLSHPNIVKYLGGRAPEKKDYVEIYMEFIAGGGNLDVFCREHPLTARNVQAYTAQVLSALAYLHQLGIVHRDVKGANCLLDQHGVVRLSDFGTAAAHSGVRSSELRATSAIGSATTLASMVLREATSEGPPRTTAAAASAATNADPSDAELQRLMFTVVRSMEAHGGGTSASSSTSTAFGVAHPSHPSSGSAATTTAGGGGGADAASGALPLDQPHQQSVAGTILYMAPEILLGRPATPACDIWALGCFVVELATANYPMHERGFKHTSAVVKYVARERRHAAIPDKLGEEGRDFLLRCFEYEPERRATAEELLRHPFITRQPFHPTAAVTREAVGVVAAAPSAPPRHVSPQPAQQPLVKVAADPPPAGNSRPAGALPRRFVGAVATPASRARGFTGMSQPSQQPPQQTAGSKVAGSGAAAPSSGAAGPHRGIAQRTAGNAVPPSSPQPTSQATFPAVAETSGGPLRSTPIAAVLLPQPLIADRVAGAPTPPPQPTAATAGAAAASQPTPVMAMMHDDSPSHEGSSAAPPLGRLPSFVTGPVVADTLAMSSGISGSAVIAASHVHATTVSSPSPTVSNSTRQDSGTLLGGGSGFAGGDVMLMIHGAAGAVGGGEGSPSDRFHGLPRLHVPPPPNFFPGVGAFGGSSGVSISESEMRQQIAPSIGQTTATAGGQGGTYDFLEASSSQQLAILVGNGGPHLQFQQPPSFAALPSMRWSPSSVPVAAVGQPPQGPHVSAPTDASPHSTSGASQKAQVRRRSADALSIAHVNPPTGPHNDVSPANQGGPTVAAPAPTHPPVSRLMSIGAAAASTNSASRVTRGGAAWTITPTTSTRAAHLSSIAPSPGSVPQPLAAPPPSLSGGGTGSTATAKPAKLMLGTKPSAAVSSTRGGGGGTTAGSTGGAASGTPHA